MVLTAQDIQTEFAALANEIGTAIRIKYYTFSFSGADYDIAYKTASGNAVWTSGIIQPIGGKTSTEDYKFLEQGRILLNDSKLYVNGSVNITPVSGCVKVGVGSPVNREYFVIDDGVQAYYIGATIAHQKAFIRILNGGSFIGEI